MYLYMDVPLNVCVCARASKITLGLALQFQASTKTSLGGACNHVHVAFVRGCANVCVCVYVHYIFVIMNHIGLFAGS